MSTLVLKPCAGCGRDIDQRVQPATSFDNGKTWYHGVPYYEAKRCCLERAEVLNDRQALENEAHVEVFHKGPQGND